jgi:acetyl-CoA carboxylase carboxyl transferase subunit beta
MARRASEQPTRTWNEVRPQRRSAIPEGLWLRCQACGKMVYRRHLEANLNVCPECDFHHRIGASERVAQLADPGSFQEMFGDLIPTDPLLFKDLKAYKDRLLAEQIKTGARDAIKAGRMFIKGREAMVCCLDLTFMMGSMGSVVGEKVTRAIETATAERRACVIVSASGGARMHEGILSLMQMAKTSGALALHHEAGLPFISILTHPTFGGTTASFATLGDLILAEPKSIIGFAGPVVIRETTHQKLPPSCCGASKPARFLRQEGSLSMAL